MGAHSRQRASAFGAYGNYGSRTTPAQLNRQICAAAEHGDVRKLFHIVESKLGDMNYVNLCTTLHRLGKMVKESGEVFESQQDELVRALIKQVKGTLEYASSTPNADPQPQCLSTIAWSAARLQISDLDVMQMIGSIAITCLPRFKHFELANLLWGFAKLRIPNTDLFHEVQMYVIRNTDRFTIGSLSTIAWAFATIQFQPCWRLLSKIVDSVSDNLRSEDASPVSIANLVWALATAGVHARKGALLSIAKAALASLSSFKAHELAITLWAFAHLVVFPEDLFSQAATHFAKTAKLQKEMHVQGIANFLWALAKKKAASHDQSLAHVPGDTLPQLLLICEKLLPQAGQVEATAILWSVSELAEYSGNQAIADRIWISLSNQQGTDERFFYGFSATSADRIRNAYSKFFASVMSPPAECQAFMSRLEHYGQVTTGDVSNSDFTEVASYMLPDDAHERPDFTSLTYGTVEKSEDMPAEPEYVHSCSFMTAEDMLVPWGGMLTEPAYVLLDIAKLCAETGHEYTAASSIPLAVSAPEITIMLECMDTDGSVRDPQIPVIVAFAVTTYSADSVVNIRADITGGGVPPALEEFPINATSNGQGLYSLTVPARLGTWTITMYATELSTGLQSLPVSVRFAGRRVEAPAVSESERDPTSDPARKARSSCAGSEGSTYAESEASEHTP